MINLLKSHLNPLFKSDMVYFNILKSTITVELLIKSELNILLCRFFFTWIKIEFSPLFTALKKCISSNHEDFLCLEGYPGDLLELKKCLDFLPITKPLIRNLASFLVKVRKFQKQITYVNMYLAFIFSRNKRKFCAQKLGQK